MLNKQKKLSLSLLAISTSTKDPVYSVLVNQEEITSSIIETVEPFKNKVQYHISIDNLKEIEVKLFNKDPNDTRVVDGTIVEDLLVIIDSVEVNGINLKDKLTKISQYKDIDGKIHHTNGYLSFNGTYKIKLHKNLLYTDWLASFL